MAKMLLVIMWSSGFIGAGLGTRYAPADTLLAWRYIVVVATLVVVVRATGTRISWATTPRAALVGALTQVGYLGGIVGGVGYGVPAGPAALIASLQPLVVAALATPLLGERTTIRQRIGLVLGIVGVAMVVVDELGGSAPAYAYLLVIGGMLALSAGTILERRWQPSRSLLEALTVHSCVSAIAFVGLAAGLGHLQPPAETGFWAAVAWVVVLSTFGGYGAYNYVTRHSGATVVSTLLYLTPPTTVVWAYVMFGEIPSPAAYGGMAVTALGVALTLLPARPASAEKNSRKFSAGVESARSCSTQG